MELQCPSSLPPPAHMRVRLTPRPHESLVPRADSPTSKKTPSSIEGFGFWETETRKPATILAAPELTAYRFTLIKLRRDRAAESRHPEGPCILTSRSKSGSAEAPAKFSLRLRYHHRSGVSRSNSASRGIGCRARSDRAYLNRRVSVASPAAIRFARALRIARVLMATSALTSQRMTNRPLNQIESTLHVINLALYIDGQSSKPRVAEPSPSSIPAPGSLGRSPREPRDLDARRRAQRLRKVKKTSPLERSAILLRSRIRVSASNRSAANTLVMQAWPKPGRSHCLRRARVSGTPRLPPHLWRVILRAPDVRQFVRAAGRVFPHSRRELLSQASLKCGRARRGLQPSSRA